jgi:hypothetical protein
VVKIMGTLESTLRHRDGGNAARRPRKVATRTNKKKRDRQAWISIYLPTRSVNVIELMDAMRGLGPEHRVERESVYWYAPNDWTPKTLRLYRLQEMWVHARRDGVIDYAEALEHPDFLEKLELALGCGFAVKRVRYEVGNWRRNLLNRYRTNHTSPLFREIATRGFFAGRHASIDDVIAEVRRRVPGIHILRGENASIRQERSWTVDDETAAIEAPWAKLGLFDHDAKAPNSTIYGGLASRVASDSKIWIRASNRAVGEVVRGIIKDMDAAKAAEVAA